MPLVPSDLGLIAQLEAAFNNNFPTSKDLTLKLYCNNITPSDDDTAATYTEANGGGYAPKTLTCGSWVCSVVGGIPQMSYEKQIITFTGPLTTNADIYGYYIVDGNNVLRWAEKFTGPATPIADGNHIDITPKYQLSHGTPQA